MDSVLLVKAVILGIVEGITEFLPISSTGHLIIVGDLLNYNNAQSKVFEIAIQLAAILAVCWEYRRRIGVAICGLTHDATQQRFALLILIGFLPAAVLGVLLHHTIKAYLFNPITVAAALIVGGLAILYIERRARQARFTTVESMPWRQALYIGLAQSLAMVPGVSRAGATILGGMIFGLSRKAAIEFSFFLAIPTMFGATVYDVYKNWSLLQIDDLAVFIAGSIAAFIAAMITVKALLKFIAQHSFVAFAWYRLVFGGLVLATYFLGIVDWSHP
ncbi:MAG: undecaprenyl-diphosphate phosphatase [Gammaproteobacteria bacterium]|nr:undecaprenyl-diphosphate phosphatase [Gammaproteobacteria bacterium]